jgi:cellulose synthase/poly-beta-1,6-N-acetylglucosamine synthase-like glycosyltransferase
MRESLKNHLASGAAGLASYAFVIYLFYTLSGLLLIQGLLSLLEGIKFLFFVRRQLARPASSFLPKATIIAPCKGLDEGLSESLGALFTQDYPDYEIIFAVASEADPAVRVIEDLRRQYPNRKSRLVVASTAPGRSEKINNLLRALQSMDEPLDSTREAILFVDSDARVREDWLRSLVAPLARASVGAATGCRWYLPAREGFWAAMLSAWNGSIATTLGDHRRNFAWGGSTAIMRDTFDRLDVRAAWEGAVSDDYALTRSVERAGLGIEFVPRCLVVSREQVSLGGLLEFTTRQIIITRVYRPEAWWLGIVTYTLFVLTFFGAIASTAAIAMTGSILIAPVLILLVIYLFGSLKGALRLMAAREALPRASGEIIGLWWIYCLLWPLVSLLFFYNFWKSATTRRISWRGVRYELRSPTDTLVVRE